MRNKGFSIAEAMITLLIVSVGLAAMAPMMSKKNKPVAEVVGGGIPSGAIMFFNLDECPDGWKLLKDNGGNDVSGHYLRIKNSDENNGQKIEQMVHKHKHVSPLLGASISNASINTSRYGPFLGGLRSTDANADAVWGDAAEAGYNGYSKITTAGYTTLSSNLLYGIQYTGGSDSAPSNTWYFFTSDGMNREETLLGSDGTFQVPVCPNKEETASGPCSKNNLSNVVLPSGLSINLPSMSEMALVGNENRPNSIAYLACEKK
jgi:hypothetical protein